MPLPSAKAPDVVFFSRPKFPSFILPGGRNENKQFLFLVAMALLMCSISSAVPIVCPDGANYATYLALNASGGCFIGDKLFTSFSYSATSIGTTPVPASAVRVTTIGSPVATILDPVNFGFLFNAPWFVGAGQTLDSVIDFTVTTISGQRLIVDDTLTMAGGFSGTGVARVDETVCLGGPIGGCPPGGGRDKHVFTSLATGTRLTDHIPDATRTFPAQSTVSVIKDILVTGGENGTANITVVINTVSQPEPATLLMIGSGLLGLGLLHRKMKR